MSTFNFAQLDKANMLFENKQSSISSTFKLSFKKKKIKVKIKAYCKILIAQSICVM